MSRPDLIPALYHPRVKLTAAERGVLTAVLLIGFERDGMVQARFIDVAKASGMTTRNLRKMAAKGACFGLAEWAEGFVGVICGALAKAEQISGKAELCSGYAELSSAKGVISSENGTKAELSSGYAELSSAGTAGATRAGVTIHPLQGVTPPSGGRSRASVRDHADHGNTSSPSDAAASPPTHHQGQGEHGNIATDAIPADVINRWSAVVEAGAMPTKGKIEPLTLAWRKYDGDVVRLAVAELEDEKIEKYGRCPKPAWLLDRCKRIHGERTGGGRHTASPNESWATFDPESWERERAEREAADLAKWRAIAKEVQAAAKPRDDDEEDWLDAIERIEAEEAAARGEAT